MAAFHLAMNASAALLLVPSLLVGDARTNSSCMVAISLKKASSMDLTLSLNESLLRSRRTAASSSPT
jgi:hypothetical protein